MTSKVRPVTAKALQTLLTRIGSVSSGTKDVLHTRLSRDIWRERLFDLRPDWKARKEKDWGRRLRIISIDMGIKNLAYCDAELDYPRDGGSNAIMDIIRWDKIDLVSASRTYRSHLPNPRLIKEGSAESDQDVDPYSLEVLSHTAYTFVKSVVLDVRPDIVLIERQRWRSASSAAIQQWTVRVNTLEAMIWAILDTLKMERSVVVERLQEHDAKRDYEVFGVDPKRVGQYWLSQHARALAEDEGGSTDVDVVQKLAQEAEGKGTTKKVAKIPRSKAEKKAKIAILRSWLIGDTTSTAPSTPSTDSTISFKIGHNAAGAFEALTPSTTRTKRKSTKSKEDGTKEVEDAKDTQIKKLDDITDCFLQAAAWVAWETNRKQLLEVWQSSQEKNTESSELNDEILRAMLAKVDGG